MSKTTRVAITGLGVFCPIGCEPSEILAALRQARSGIVPLTLYSTEGLQSKAGGEVSDVALDRALEGRPVGSMDRTAKLALAAALQAWEMAKVPSELPRERIGLCTGASGAGLSHDSAEDVFRLRFQPHEQGTAVISALKIAGPVVMFSSASTGSGLALVHAMNLLRSGRCDLVLAGGAECLSKVNQESMDSMRLCSAGPCSPFSGEPGLTVGEGSAFFVLERLDDAVNRQATVHAELLGYGVTQDAYHIVGGNPSGEGLARALTCALRSAGLEPSDVDWIKANGTSNRDQDTAETLAIKQVFSSPPPISAVESFVGHANGAAPAIGLGLAVIAFENALIPPTLHFRSPRPGCDLDYVPNKARVSNASHVIANSVGFGGSNVSLLFGRRQQVPENVPQQRLCITGVGVVSPFGEGFTRFIEGLRGGCSAITLAEQMFAARVNCLGGRNPANKLTLLQRFALSAAKEALESARIAPGLSDSDQLGLFVGLCRGSAAARSQYALALSDKEARKQISRCVLRMARFTVASALAQRFRLKGIGATISEGFGAGLHALAHACIHLENSSSEQALLVVAADETGPGPASSLAEMNWLAAGHDGCFLRPYAPESKGTLPGEGAVALVVERTVSAEKRGAAIRAHIEGVGLTTGEQSGSLADAARQAMAHAHSQQITCAYGNGSGIWPHDEAELHALREVLPMGAPIGCVNYGIGFAESTSGLFHVVAALHGLSEGEFFPLRQGLKTQCMEGSFRHQLLTARTEGHRNAAVVVSL